MLDIASELFFTLYVGSEVFVMLYRRPTPSAVRAGAALEIVVARVLLREMPLPLRLRLRRCLQSVWSMSERQGRGAGAMRRPFS